MADDGPTHDPAWPEPQDPRDDAPAASWPSSADASDGEDVLTWRPPIARHVAMRDVVSAPR